MKKKNILIVGILLLIIVLVIMFSYFASNNNNNENNSNNKTNDPTMDRVIELIDNSYKYYLLKEGLIDLGEDTFDDGERIYVSENVEWIKELSDIQDIILDTFTRELKIDLYTNLNEKQKFIELDNVIYVSLSEESCKINYNVDKENMTYKIREDGSMVIDLGDVKAYAYKENNVWRLRSLPYDCENNK